MGLRRISEFDNKSHNSIIIAEMNAQCEYCHALKFKRDAKRLYFAGGKLNSVMKIRGKEKVGQIFLN